MNHTTSSSRLAEADRTALLALTLGAAVVAAIVASFTLIGLIFSIVSGSTTLTVGLNSPMPSDLYPAGVDSARYIEGEITTSALTFGTNATLLVAYVLAGLSYTVVALAVVNLGRSLLRGDPFRRSVIWSTMAASIALIAGTGFAGLLTAVGTALALDELTGTEFMSEQNPLIVSFDFTPFFVGVAIGIVAGAFQVGQRMQRDTEGLV